MRPVSPQPAETGRVRLGGMCIAMQRQAHRLTRPAGGAVGQPAVQESLIWSQTYWPDDGRLEAAYMHAHMRRFDELWVFAAPASSLGLNAPPLHNTDVNPATPFIPSLHGLSNQQVKDIVMSNFAASSNRRCLPAIPATPPIPPPHTHTPPAVLLARRHRGPGARPTLLLQKCVLGWWGWAGCAGALSHDATFSDAKFANREIRVWHFVIEK
jgi:hypothetical protein